MPRPKSLEKNLPKSGDSYQKLCYQLAAILEVENGDHPPVQSADGTTAIGSDDAHGQSTAPEDVVSLESWNYDLVYNAVNLTLAAASGLVDGESGVDTADDLADLVFQAMQELRKYEDITGSVVFNALPKYHDAEGRVALDCTSRLQASPTPSVCPTN